MSDQPRLLKLASAMLDNNSLDSPLKPSQTVTAPLLVVTDQMRRQATQRACDLPHPSEWRNIP